MSTQHLAETPNKVTLSKTAKQDLLRQGWTAEKIELALSDAAWPGKFNPLEEYRETVGYQFHWGKVIERRIPLSIGGWEMLEWEFILDRVVGTAHEAEQSLKDVGAMCMRYLASFNHKQWPVNLHSGEMMSCFTVTTIAVGNNKNEEYQLARAWVDKELLGKILVGLQSYLIEELATNVTA